MRAVLLLGSIRGTRNTTLSKAQRRAGWALRRRVALAAFLAEPESRRSRATLLRRLAEIDDGDARVARCQLVR